MSDATHEMPRAAAFDIEHGDNLLRNNLNGMFHDQFHGLHATLI